MGNLNEEENRAVVDAVARGIELPDWVNTTTGRGEVQKVMPVVDPKQPVELRMLNPRPGDTNDVAIVSIISGVATVESRVAFGLLGQILQPLAYEELRTQRQLGYVVSAGASSISNVQYISAVVQGHALGADDQEAAIELLYNELMPKRLANLSDEEFASIRHATEQTLLQPPVAPQDELGHFWGPVAKGGRCFSLQSAVLDYLNSSAVTKDMLVKTWAELVTPWKKGTRKKFVTKFYAGKVPERQTDEEVEAAMKAQGVPGDALPMIMRERAASKVLADSSAAEREKLAKSGGFFPVDLHCGDDERASS
jgi:secreted Zn-dependent insulinase-like peptidase